MVSRRSAFIKMSFWRFLILFVSLSLATWPGMAHPAQDFVEGEVLVTFKPSITLNSADRALAGHSLSFKKHYRLGKHSGLIHDDHRTTAQLITDLSSDPTVERVEPNYLRWVNSVPNDNRFTNLWALRNLGQQVNGVAGTAGIDIRFLAAWNLARPTTNPVVVAVIDTGTDYTHPDLTNNMWVNPGEIAGNGLDDDGDGYVDDLNGYDFADGLSNPSDSGVHGTHVAGTIAATGNNQLGVIGVNYQAKIMALRVSNDGNSISTSAELEALEYAIMMKNRGVNLVAINASYGGGGYMESERAAIQAAGDAGIIFCAAAGNDASDNDSNAFYPANYRLTNMIVVAATDQNDALAGFSNYGASMVDLAAPGVNILSLRPVSQPGKTTAVQQGATTFEANELAFSGSTTGITATAYYCGIGNPSDFPPSVQGNIAVIARGTLLFSDKVANAMAAGATAVVIYNNVSGGFNGTLQYASGWIPAVSVSQTDGLALQAGLPAIVTVLNKTDPTQVYQYLQGTSMASPHVAGAVAFAAQNFPDETVPQRVQRILANVDPVASLAGKVSTGGRLNLQRIVDTDLNGLPDWWEQTYFGQLTGTPPNTDADHDGLSNLSEWLAGTNPTNAASTLRLTATVAGNAMAFL